MAKYRDALQWMLEHPEEDPERQQERLRMVAALFSKRLDRVVEDLRFHGFRAFCAAITEEPVRRG
jgi:hypothetical protein